MTAQTWCRFGVAGLMAGSVVLASSDVAVAVDDDGHGIGRMGPRVARTVAVSPSTGVDYEMPFVCGQRWTGTTRSSHSPSRYSVDWNTPNDLGKPALASMSGVVTKAVSLRDSYGKYVVVDHGGGFTSLYAHLRNISTTVGTFLDQGDLLGRVGSTGGSTGPHLHFEERKDGGYFPPYFHRVTYQFGATRSSANCADRPVAGDWNGNGAWDLGVYRSTPTGGEFRLRSGRTVKTIPWGGPNDTPLVGDWDGNAISDVGHRRLGTTLFTKRAANGTSSSYSGVGSATDTTVTGDWDGDGASDVGAYRASNHTFLLRSKTGSYTTVPWGGSGDRAVSGDWSRQGYDEIGVFNPATRTWKLRVRRSTGITTRTVVFGRPGDLPVTGDWNRDGVTDLGTWTPSTATFTLREPRDGGYATRTIAFGNRR